MAKSNDLMNRINSCLPDMSKGQKHLAAYIESNYDKAVSLTAAKLGETVGVSESTVVRFAAALGYKGYPEFQKALEETVRTRLNSVQRVEAASTKMKDTGILKSVLLADAEKIRKTCEDIDPKAFDRAVERILEAKNIYIIGIRSCAPLASFLSYYFGLIFDNVHQLITSSSSELFEQMVRIGEGDVIIGISFPRYSKRTQKALEFAYNRHATVITITDSINSPINQYASECLTAYSDMASMVDSLVAPLSVMNALIVALCMKKRTQVVSTLTELEKIWGEYKVYDDSDTDFNKQNTSIG